MADIEQELRKRDFLEGLIYAGYDPTEVVPSRPGPSRRYTQDSPVMPDVWIHYGLEPHQRHDLLLTPAFERSPGRLMLALTKRIEEDRDTELHQRFVEIAQSREIADEGANIAVNQTTVVAELWFHQLVRSALPLTDWWRRRLAMNEDPAHHPVKLIREDAEAFRDALIQALSNPTYDSHRGPITTNMAWMARVVGTISLLADPSSDPDDVTVDDLDRRSRDPQGLANAIIRLIDIDDQTPDEDVQLHDINRNRRGSPAIYRSVPTVKGDAARMLFDVKGAGITWAVLDSGIDARHWAFRKRDQDEEPAVKPFSIENGEWVNHTRIKATYDFTKLRRLLSSAMFEKAAGLSDELRDHLRDRLAKGLSLDWDLVAPALRVPHRDDEYVAPTHFHGTHVAGILGADWRSNDDENDSLPFSAELDERPNDRTGVCPEIEILDLRVLDQNGRGHEFEIMAALQFVRSLNARRDYVSVHGVNLSLALNHEVSNYACGRTPICNEADRLVGAGIVVVAAAGNNGRVRFLTREGDIEAYMSISITDPGNAVSVITVGATHRWEPHNYGVSYFSSRGPTGDGRLKPDLVAPGEKITSTVPNNREDNLDGTSMSAPHVSGAAALIMCRHPELIGQPDRIKQILCDNATDLGREAYFQGAGLLDILRSLQAV